MLDGRQIAVEDKLADSQVAGQRAAVLKRLIESAKLNRHDPWTQFKDVGERLPTLRDRDLAQFLPHSTQPATAIVEPTTAAASAPRGTCSALPEASSSAPARSSQPTGGGSSTIHASRPSG